MLGIAPAGYQPAIQPIANIANRRYMEMKGLCHRTPCNLHRLELMCPPHQQCDNSKAISATVDGSGIRQCTWQTESFQTCERRRRLIAPPMFATLVS